MKDEEVVITLSKKDYRLLQAAISAAQNHPGASEEARQAWADIGWAIHYQTQY